MSTVLGLPRQFTDGPFTDACRHGVVLCLAPEAIRCTVHRLVLLYFATRLLVSHLLCVPIFLPSPLSKTLNLFTMVLFSRMLARARSVPNKLLSLKVPSRPMSEVAIEVEAGYSTYVEPVAVWSNAAVQLVLCPSFLFEQHQTRLTTSRTAPMYTTPTPRYLWHGPHMADTTVPCPRPVVSRRFRSLTLLLRLLTGRAPHTPPMMPGVCRRTPPTTYPVVVVGGEQWLEGHALGHGRVHARGCRLRSSGAAVQGARVEQGAGKAAGCGCVRWL